MRQLTTTQLTLLLKNHTLWIKTSSEQGERADLTGANLRSANLQCADLRSANLQGADLTGADLEGANLRSANLQCANLEGAILRGADLTGADLQCANLEGAILRGANILIFQFKCDTAYFTGTHIKIGCEFHSIDHWAKEYKTIGQTHGYSRVEIQAYGHFIKVCALNARHFTKGPPNETK